MTHRHKKHANPNAEIIQTCIELIRTFNPVTHSIDTHCSERLGSVSLLDARAEDIMIQQIVYGWSKEKAVLKCFIDDFYSDYASRVLRVDMIFYTVFAYIALFRMEEIGVPRFKELGLSQEPSKVSTFVEYLFNKENLWNMLRSSWMKVRDLPYVEEELIPRVEKFIPQMMRFIMELENTAASNAAAEAAKEEAKAKGEAGLVKVARKASTVPVSPRLTQTRIPALPEPERIGQNVEAKPVPGFLENTNLSKLATQRDQRAQKVKESTQSKYSSKHEFKFHKTKGGRPIEEVRKEVEEKELSALAFNSTFYNEPPNFRSQSADFKVNAAAILREDFLYRKQQAKDAQILKNYEDELRDPTEYYLWQQDLRERDDRDKLNYVALRREQARQSAIEAKDAMERQREDNYSVASLMRDQADVIKKEKELEREIERLKNQQTVQSIMEVREVKPYEAVKAVLDARAENGKKVREDLEEARMKKEEEDRRVEALKNDRIRQLRAINTVHKKHIVVFDPTQTAGLGLLDEKSFLEMKVRLQQERQKQEESEVRKREEIGDSKQKRMSELERRKESIMRARILKAQVNQETRERQKESRRREQEEQQRATAAAKAILDKELAERRAVKEAEQAALLAEQERIKRQQQYLGVAHGQVEQMRDEQLQLAKERQARQLELEESRLREGTIASMTTDRKNKFVFERQERISRKQTIAERDENAEREKFVSLDKIKASVVEKKNMFKEGQKQHVKTHRVNVETNPYAATISQESLIKAQSSRLASSGANALRSDRRSVRMAPVT